ncbi:hypothetical protein D9C73_003470 [Collichthys lucidus]|uniref:Uncharacterized protein n=1 Tax=Collichthys lucidus TaxID=240159 RepID=A0A4U5U5A9_COLLU|nr:hypothetical protein D9C73_003470 [Collichthys lucidus]
MIVHTSSLNQVEKSFKTPLCPGLQSPDPLTPTTEMRAEDILNPAHSEAMCEDDLSSSRERIETASINQSCHEGARPNASEYASARPTKKNSTASSSSLQCLLSAKHQLWNRVNTETNTFQTNRTLTERSLKTEKVFQRQAAPPLTIRIKPPLCGEINEKEEMRGTLMQRFQLLEHLLLTQTMQTTHSTKLLPIIHKGCHHSDTYYYCHAVLTFDRVTRRPELDAPSLMQTRSPDITYLALPSVDSGVFSKAPQKRRPWQAAEIRAVERQMFQFIRSSTVPSKTNCEKCLRAEAESLHNRNWQNLKFYVYNRITALKRKMHPQQ